MSNPLSRLENLLNDHTITGIMIDGWQHVYVEPYQGPLTDVSSPFQNEAELYELIKSITDFLGLQPEQCPPLLDARLQDGTRVNIAMPPVAVQGPVVTLRRFMQNPITTEELIQWGFMSQDMYDFLRLCVLGRLNICIAGGAGSGKTTFMRLLCSSIPTDERIIVLQDVYEFSLPQPRVINLETRPPNVEGRGEVTRRDLVYNALRMRPDRIILSEARGSEMLELFQAINNGHDGTLFSIHSGGVQDALSRLEVMAGTGNPSIPVLGLREQIASAIDIITYQEFLPDGSRRIMRIAEVTRLQDGIIATRDLFEFRRTGIKDGKIQGLFTATGSIPSFASNFRDAGLEIPLGFFNPV